MKPPHSPVVDDLGRSLRIQQCSVHVLRTAQLYESSETFWHALGPLLAEHGGFQWVWAGSPSEATGEIRPLMSWGFGSLFPASQKIRLDSARECERLLAEAWRKGTASVFNREASAKSGDPGAATCSCAFLPLNEQKPEAGLIALGSAIPQLFRESDLPLLATLASDIERAIRQVNLQAQLAELRASHQNSDARTRHIVDHGTEAVVIHAEGILLYGNRFAAELAGLASPADLIGRSLLEFSPPESHQNVARLLAQSAGSGRFEPWIEERLRRADGSLREVQIASSPVVFEGRSGFLLTLRDVTRRKSFEAAWCQGQPHFQAFFQQCPHPMAISRFDTGRFTAVNSAFEQASGYRADEVLGKSSLEMGFLESMEIAARVHEHLLRHGRIDNVLTRARTKSGELRQVRYCAVIEQTPDGPCIISQTTDETENLQKDLSLRERLATLEEQLLRAQRIESLGNLACGVAHDLNNMLAPILLFSELIEGTLQNPQQKSMLQMLKTSTQRGADMVRQLLLYSRGGTEPSASLDLRRHTRELLKLARDTFPKNITFATRIQESLWSIRGDPTQLHQVLLNLCLNARDALPEGGTITLAAENLELAVGQPGTPAGLTPGPYVLLRVSDTGTGIPPENLEKIFDPFFTTKQAGLGTGLGLATVLRILKSQGGAVEVASQMGRGSEFRLYFAARRSADPPPSASLPAPPAPRPGCCVLLADDEELLRLQTSEWLESKGYQVLAAGDGFEALSLYCRHQDKIQAVILDLWMPHCDGKATLRELRKISPSVPVLLMSGLPDFEAAAKELKPGVQACLSKPWEPARMLATLAQIIPPAPAAL
jgi:PAS domain S-box-containing protein